MKKMAAILFYFCFFPYPSRSQSASPVIDIAGLRAAITKTVQEQHTPGLMVGIVSRDSVLLSEGFGYADVRSRRRVDGSTLFRMGSITKMFVSLGILQLISEGRLGLYTPLRAVAPEIPFRNKWEDTNPVK